MVAVLYQHEFDYLYSVAHGPFPGLVVRIQDPNAADRAVDVVAHLDSGATYSLFEGWVVREIGLQLLDGQPRTYRSTGGDAIEARIHRVVIAHPDLGLFPLDIGFGTGTIHRNLLGLDFFNLIQIGFRERQQEFYVTAQP